MPFAKLETGSQLRFFVDGMVYTCPIAKDAKYGDVAHSPEKFSGELSLRLVSIVVPLAEALAQLSFILLAQF